jgi:hypothetical protein
VSTERDLEEIIAKYALLTAYLGIGLLLAFPVKWCWNYALVSMFEFPVITWGQAWCLYFLSTILIKSIHYHLGKSDKS